MNFSFIIFNFTMAKYISHSYSLLARSLQKKAIFSWEEAGQDESLVLLFLEGPSGGTFGGTTVKKCCVAGVGCQRGGRGKAFPPHRFAFYSPRSFRKNSELSCAEDFFFPFVGRMSLGNSQSTLDQYLTIVFTQSAPEGLPPLA